MNNSFIDSTSTKKPSVIEGLKYAMSKPELRFKIVESVVRHILYLAAIAILLTINDYFLLQGITQICK